MRKSLIEKPTGGALGKVAWRMGFILLSLRLSPQAFAADADDEVIEEVVVTGSFLKRTAADSPSPLSVITSADIEDLGAADVAEVIRSLPWNSGSQTTATTFQGGGSDGRTNINLRNLGHGATLPLVNGKRHVPSWYNGRGNASTNINALVPNIAIDRMEIVKDGASALYGSDAIAGVVNFLTKSTFEGFDASYQFTTDDETGEGDANQAAFIIGVQGDRGGIVASASFLNRDEINIADNYSRFGGTTISSTGQPGRLTPLAGQNIIWAANGLNPGQFVDPGYQTKTQIHLAQTTRLATHWAIPSGKQTSTVKMQRHSRRVMAGHWATSLIDASTTTVRSFRFNQKSSCATSSLRVITTSIQTSRRDLNWHRTPQSLTG